MKILPEPLTFQWDQGNILKNLQKHNVTRQEGEEMVMSEPFIVSEDIKHSTVIEQRYQALGKTRASRRLFAAFTIRDNQIRIISIRDMSKKEEQAYAKFEANTTI